MTFRKPYSAIIPDKWDTQDEHSPMVNFVQQFNPVTDEFINYIDTHTFRCEIKKDKHLIKAGEMCDYLYLITNGVLRGYVKDGAKDLTNWIAFENSLVTSARSFFLRSPATKNIQAIETSELIGVHFDALEYSFNHFMEMNIIGRKILEQYYRAAEERSLIARLPRASSKYERFLATYGDLAQRIQLKYIASHLGVTLETLSRIRSKAGKESS